MPQRCNGSTAPHVHSGKTFVLTRLFLPNPRKCKISREWHRLTDQNALYRQGSHVKLRYTPSGRQRERRKPVNIGRRQPIVRNGPPSSSPIRRLYPCTAVAPIETPPDKGRAAEPRPPAPWGPRRSRPHRRTGRRRCHWAAAPRDYPRIRPYRGSGRRTRCGSDVT